ncbi:WhiB family transcriptional regulator [Streptomyces sp. NPDC048527]|uniref:WhiB family transcriptional regulator n=1 Tax=Streptomyces sp. NPDC048527 TaxID=3365568 RepID=UPI003722A1C3
MNPHLTGDTRHIPHNETARAACTDADPALFFPSVQGSAYNELVENAKTLCADCAIRRECLARAIRHSETEGIWGGFTGRERRSLRDHAHRLHMVSPQLITDLRAGLRVPVPAKERPGVVSRLLGLGWSENQIAEALGVAPFAVQIARRLAEDAAAYRAAEQQAGRPLALTA